MFSGTFKDERAGGEGYRRVEDIIFFTMAKRLALILGLHYDVGDIPLSKVLSINILSRKFR